MDNFFPGKKWLLIMDDFMLSLDKVKDIEETFGVNRESEVREVKVK